MFTDAVRAVEAARTYFDPARIVVYGGSQGAGRRGADS
ncbi:acetylxylan esterase [Streptomyces finlayi]|nr:acetylxylan esterase [Streptomyces finlayi]